MGKFLIVFFIVTAALTGLWIYQRFIAQQSAQTVTATSYGSNSPTIPIVNSPGATVKNNSENVFQSVGAGNSGNVAQLNNSPNSPVNQNITNINIGRRIRGASSKKLIQLLASNPCPITVGVLGMGGEPEVLANDFLDISKSAGCPTQGIFHGVGFDSFNGIQIKFSPRNTPTNSILAIIGALQENHFDFASGFDPSQADGSIYIFVGFNQE